MNVHGGNWNGLALRLRRVEAGWSVEELAAKLTEMGHKVAFSSVARWERGTRQPGSEDVVASLSALFSCSELAFYRKPILTYDTANERDD
jgi:transcriptional regulator with XRE-family HTH domain